MRVSGLIENSSWLESSLMKSEVVLKTKNNNWTLICLMLDGSLTLQSLAIEDSRFTIGERRAWYTIQENLCTIRVHIENGLITR